MNAMLQAASEENLELVKEYIENGADVNYANGVGGTALYFASEGGYLAIVKYLLEKGARVNEADSEQRTAFHVAAKGGYLDVVKYLHENGANVNPVDKIGRTALHLAAEGCYLDVVKYLEEKGAYVNQPDNTGKTALHFAVQALYIFGIEEEDDYNEDEDNDILEIKGLNVAKYLHEKGADINLPDENGDIPLHVAAWFCRFSIIHFFARNGI